LNQGPSEPCYPTALNTEIVFQIRHYWRHGKWLTDINLLLILIRQIAALVRRALAEVCTVSVLLVMAALRNRAGYYIFARWFLLSFFLSIFFLRLIAVTLTTSI